jgi:hypothetical protein
MVDIDDNASNPHIHEPANGQIDQGVSGNGKQGFGNMFRVRPEPGTKPGGQNQRFHVF